MATNRASVLAPWEDSKRNNIYLDLLLPPRLATDPLTPAEDWKTPAWHINLKVQWSTSYILFNYLFQSKETRVCKVKCKVSVSIKKQNLDYNDFPKGEIALYKLYKQN